MHSSSLQESHVDEQHARARRAQRCRAEHGVVIMDGPGPLTVTLTPEAAELTGGRLRTAAAAALLQTLDPDLPVHPTDEQ